MSKGQSCSLKKPEKEGARNCALGLLIKVMKRTIKKSSIRQNNNNEDTQIGYTPLEIETVISNTYRGRDQYLSKIAKVALHLSLFTRTGRVSFTFQEAIFNKKTSTNSNRNGMKINGMQINNMQKDDYLVWLMTNATEEDIFPELYLSQDYVQKIDRDNFERQMHLEHDALLAGLKEIVRKCCDSKVCTLDEIDTSYDQDLFKSGTAFETAARSICMTRKVDSWSSPSSEIFVPDTTPISQRVSLLPDETPSADFSTQDNRTFTEHANENDTTLVESQLRKAKNENGSLYGLEKESYERNFDVSGQIMCFDVNNLIANLADLEPGRRMVLPWAGELLSKDLQKDFTEKFRVEISMRQYFLLKTR